jgi:2-hydroxy-6-oxonona-2,4-dienedioate hydrolase
MSIISLLTGKNSWTRDEIFLKSRAPIHSIPLHLENTIRRRRVGNHLFLEGGNGKPVIFCHGLFGGIFNIDKVVPQLSSEYRFIMPYLPMYDLPLMDCTIKKLGDYLDNFIRTLRLKEAVLIGSSMGGGTALYYTYKSNQVVKGLVLCGSSGLSSIPMSKGFFKRKNYDFVKEATQDIFYNRTIPPDVMIQDVYDAIQHPDVVIRAIRYTKAATNCKMVKELTKIETPTLLLWGAQDPITPPEIALDFQKLMPYSELYYVPECGHVPTQEKPAVFLSHFYKFLKKISY